MGRPKLNPELVHKKGILVRLTNDEKEILERASKLLNKTQSDIIRCALSWFYGEFCCDEDEMVGEENDES